MPNKNLTENFRLNPIPSQNEPLLSASPVFDSDFHVGERIKISEKNLKTIVEYHLVDNSLESVLDRLAKRVFESGPVSCAKPITHDGKKAMLIVSA
jgi:hypothetical protein